MDISDKVTTLQKRMAVILRGYGLWLSYDWQALSSDLRAASHDLEEVELRLLDSEGGRWVLSYVFPFHQPNTQGRDLLLVPVQGRVVVPQLRLICQGRVEKDLPPDWVRTWGNGDQPEGYQTLGNGCGRIVAHHSLRCRGVVANYPPGGTFGFISTGGSGIFFHRHWVQGAVQVGDEVTFLPVISPQGPQAHLVRPASPELN